jgi:hypothetical protein
MPSWTREPLGLPTLPVAHDRVAGVLGRVATRAVRWASSGDRELAAGLRASATARSEQWAS